MINKHRNERLKEVCFDSICQACPVSKVLSIQHKCIRASRRSIRIIKAFASRTSCSSLGIDIIKYTFTSTSTIDGTEHIRTDTAQSWAGNSRTKRSRQCAHFNLLKVLLARVPLSIHLQLQIEIIIDASCIVASSFPRSGLEAHAIIPILLAVQDIYPIFIGGYTAVQVGGLHA